MKKMIAAVLALALLFCGAAFATQSDALLSAIDNASFLIMEINSSGSGLRCDGVFDDAQLNMIAILFSAEDYAFDEILEMKQSDPGAYKELMASYLSLSNEFSAMCDADLYEKIHVVFGIMSSDGVGLFLTVDNIDLTWMLCDY